MGFRRSPKYSATAVAAAHRAHRYPKTASQVPQDNMSLKDSFFSRMVSLTTGVHHSVRGLPPLEAPKTLWPQDTAAASTMEALNIIHSGSISPASTGMLEKLLRRWELKASQTGASPRRSQLTRTTCLCLPGLSGDFSCHRNQLITKC